LEVAAAVVVAVWCGTAAAEPGTATTTATATATTTTARTGAGLEGYTYEFGDDPLNAGGFGPHDARITVAPRPKRVTLIRPRFQFVQEMLKSVEMM
jgi:hypothetical protein